MLSKVVSILLAATLMVILQGLRGSGANIGPMVLATWFCSKIHQKLFNELKCVGSLNHLFMIFW